MATNIFSQYAGSSKQVMFYLLLLNVLNIFTAFNDPIDQKATVYTNMIKLKKMPNTKKQVSMLNHIS